MALENTGKAFPNAINIVRKEGGEVTLEKYYSILEAFDSYPSLHSTDWAERTEAYAQKRIDDFLRYLRRQPELKGLDPLLAAKNQAIVSNLTSCPLPSQAKKLIITLKSDNESIGICRFSENNLTTIEIVEGVGVHPTVEILNANYEFEGWYKNGTQKLNTLQQTITYFLTESCTLVAKFRYIEPEEPEGEKCRCEINTATYATPLITNTGIYTVKATIAYRTTSNYSVEQYIDTDWIYPGESETVYLQTDVEEVTLHDYRCS